MITDKLSDVANPIELFREWMDEAVRKEGQEDATAMSVATIGEDGMPDVRMLLLKEADERGFVFYTNLESTKGRQLALHPVAALCFHWKSLSRQVRLRGPVEPVSPEEADAYFKTRARDSRIGAWASSQSRPLETPHALEKRVALFAARYAVGEIPRPPHWSGFRLKPATIEFWVSRPFRLHERLRFERRGDGWTTERLYP